MPHWDHRNHPEGTTMEEFRKLLSLRLDTLAEATTQEGSFFPLPVQWRIGWRAQIIVLGRDRDGSLKALIEVTGPQLATPYRRYVRLISRTPLPYSLRIE